MSEASGAISGDDEEDEAAMEQELRRRMQESICSASAQKNTIKKQARGNFTLVVINILGTRHFVTCI